MACRNSVSFFAVKIDRVIEKYDPKVQANYAVTELKEKKWKIKKKEKE